MSHLEVIAHLLLHCIDWDAGLAAAGGDFVALSYMRAVPALIQRFPSMWCSAWHWGCCLSKVVPVPCRLPQQSGDLPGGVRPWSEGGCLLHPGLCGRPHSRAGAAGLQGCSAWVACMFHGLRMLFSLQLNRSRCWQSQVAAWDHRKPKECAGLVWVHSYHPQVSTSGPSPCAALSPALLRVDTPRAGRWWMLGLCRCWCCACKSRSCP